MAASSRQRTMTMGSADLRRVAVAAECDPKAVARELAQSHVPEDARVQNMVRHRIRRALKSLKLGPYRERE